MIDSEEAARRLARTIVSDMTVYHKELVKDGIKNDNIFEVMESNIEEGLRFYKDQVSPLIQKQCNYFNEALVDILVIEASEIEAKIW